MTPDLSRKCAGMASLSMYEKMLLCFGRASRSVAHRYWFHCENNWLSSCSEIVGETPEFKQFWEIAVWISANMKPKEYTVNLIRVRRSRGTEFLKLGSQFSVREAGLEEGPLENGFTEMGDEENRMKS